MNNKKSKINETNIKMYLGTNIKGYVVEAIKSLWNHELIADMRITRYNSLIIEMKHPDVFTFTMTNDETISELDTLADPIGFLSHLAYKSTIVIEDGYIQHELFINDIVFRGEVTLKEAFELANFKKLEIGEKDDTLTQLIKGIINESQIDVEKLIEGVHPSELDTLRNMYTKLQQDKVEMSYRNFRSWLHYLDAKATISVTHGDNTISLDTKPKDTFNGANTFKMLTGGGIELGKTHLFVVEKAAFSKFTNWLSNYILENHGRDNYKWSLASNVTDVEQAVYNNRLIVDQTDIIIYVINRPDATPLNAIDFKMYSTVYNAYLIKATDRPAYVELKYIKTRQDIQHGLCAPFVIRVSSN